MIVQPAIAMSSGAACAESWLSGRGPVVDTAAESASDAVRGAELVVVADDGEVTVDVRGRPEVFQITKPPFVQPSVRES